MFTTARYCTINLIHFNPINILTNHFFAMRLYITNLSVFFRLVVRLSYPSSKYASFKISTFNIPLQLLKMFSIAFINILDLAFLRNNIPEHFFVYPTVLFLCSFINVLISSAVHYEARKDRSKKKYKH
jgi:hypothetical protein